MIRRCDALPGLFLLMATLLGAGCQSPRESLQALAAEHGQRVEFIHTRDYPLLYSAVRVPATPTLLRVYLEGDGHAWATPSQPSLDPSPRRLMVAQLALDDPQPSIYLARPCQFMTAPACKPAMWTGRRFSAEVLDSLDQALDQLKRRYGNQSFELVGYSGGGALALLLAARREDVVQVQTLAGNLSPQEWARLLQLTPLDGSLEPLQYRERLAHIAQRHLIAEADRQVPVAVSAYYRRQLGVARCAEFISLPGVTHEQGWEHAWRQWRGRSLECLGAQD